MKPGIFRFPGGNNLEGQTVDTRWKWKNTVGPLVDRPGRMGDWSYINTEYAQPLHRRCPQHRVSD